MITVSDGWKNARNKTLLPEMFVEITCGITEPGLQKDATASATSPESFSNLEQLVDGEVKDSEPYAALDYGVWGLDGSFSYTDGNPRNPGYVYQDYSYEDGYLMDIPTIHIQFSKVHDVSIPGIVITWSETFGGWAEDYRVYVYNDDELVAQRTILGNTDVRNEIWLSIANYNRIAIAIDKWSHPFQRVRCSDIFMGIREIYTKSDLMGYEHTQSVDLLSAALPNNSVTFKLRNDDNRWNPDNPTNMEQYLMERQEIKVRYGMEIQDTIEWIKGGTFWLSEWNTPANGMEASFTARDAVEFMGSVYTGVRSGTLYDVAIAAFIEADLPHLDDGSVRYVVDERLKEINTDFTTNTNDYTIAEVLQMVANAGNCVFYQDRDGIVHIETWSKVLTDYVIGPEISYAHPEYTLNKPLKNISVGYGENLRAVIPVGEKGETQTIDNPLISTEIDAFNVGFNAVEVLSNRKVITGEFRPDLVLDALDGVIVSSKYAANFVYLSDITYSNNGGSFKGSYTGRVIGPPDVSVEGVSV